MMISFITPTHNHEKYIERCIQSVINQDCPVEQIIVDDGSTDHTGEIARSYESSNIHYYWQPNRGISRLAETYNFAVSKASGDIIAVLEGDDAAYPRRATYHEVAFADPSVVLSWGITQRVKGDESLDIVPPDHINYISLSHHNYIRLMLTGCWISANTVAVRKSSLSQIGGFQQGPYYVDYPTWLKLLPLGNFHFTNDLLSIWGVHSDSYSSTLGNTARIDRDAISAYDSYPPHIQGVFSRTELINYWKRKLYDQRVEQSKNLLYSRQIIPSISKFIEALKVYHEY